MKHPSHPNWDKANSNCPSCCSSNTWFMPVVPDGFPDVDDLCLYCEDCKGEFV